jgi:predicted dehydrogenase
MSKVRLGVVGMGIGATQARAFTDDPRGEVTALCDLNETAMEAFAEELEGDVALYTSYEQMANDPNVDAIFVGTPNQWHVPVAMAAVKAGKHVLCTKPLSNDEPAATELVDIAEKSGVVNMMSLSMRFSAEMQYMGRMARRGDLGDIYYARARSVRRSGIPDWQVQFITAGGGAFLDMGVHLLDAAWWMTGCHKPVSITGVAGAHFGPRGQGYWDFRKPKPGYAEQYASDDFGGGIVRFENGMALQIESFWACHHADEVQIELFGTEGGAKLDPLTVYRTVDGAPADTKVRMPPGQAHRGFHAVASHFIDCILDGAECAAPLSHGLTVQRMLLGLLESAKVGKEVRLDK